MKKLVILKLKGDFETGFNVTLEIGEEGKRFSKDISDELPSEPELPKLYQEWRSLYRTIAVGRRLIAISGNTNISLPKFKEKSEALSQRFTDWLLSKSFRRIERQCCRLLDKSDEVRFLIRTDCEILQHLPWHHWDLLEDYERLEIAFSPLESEDKQKVKRKQKDKVNILAILGDSTGIDTDKDQKFLEQLPGTKITFLVEPKRRQIRDNLWEQKTDILFFAGHSETLADEGVIYINPQDKLIIEDLKNGLKKAIKSGLQLAIFNSCDGLGLAWKLQELDIPQVIVMREPVPDKVAQEFLKYFLTAFSGGKSLYLAVREAREKLHDLEDDKYPCASWLPVIVQNAAATPPTWQELRYGNINQHILRVAGVASLIVAVLTIGVRSLGLLQPSELFTYDLMMRLRPDEGQDNRLLVVEVTEGDLQYQNQRGWERQKGSSVADTALEKLLQKLNSYQARTIGLDVYRDFAAMGNLATELEKDNFFAVCKGSDSTMKDSGIAPPPEVSPQNVGFSDAVVDADGFIRRSLWNSTFNSDSPCRTENSLSLQLALHYLKAEGIKIEAPETYLQIGDLRLKRLPSHAGGYQQFDNSGYQILLNYRTRGDIAPRLTLQQVLEGNFDSSLVKNKIVLIGVTAPSIKDDWLTPFSDSQDKTMRGVFIQGQMVSQIISGVLDGRSLLWVLPWWGDGLCILVGAVGGGLIAYKFRRLSYLILTGGVVIVMLSGVYFLVFIKGWWLPLIPSVLSLVITGGIVVVYRFKLLNPQFSFLSRN